MRRWLVVVAAVAIAAIAIILWRNSRPSTPSAPAPSATAPTAVPPVIVDARGDARLTADERARLRDRILAGNAHIGRQADAALEMRDAETDEPATAADRDGDDQRSAETKAYHDKVFEIADQIVNDCRAETTDAGDRIEVSYTVISDDDAGGLFEDVELPADHNNSGPNTLECVTERMLGAILEAPPADIDRFSFSVEVRIIRRDGGAVE